MEFSEAVLRFGWDRRGGTDRWPLRPSPFPFWDLSFHLSQGCQDAGAIKELTWQSEHRALRLGLRGMPFQRESHKNALIWAHLYPCWWVTWEFLLFLSSSPPLCPSGGEKHVFWVVLFPKHLASSLHILQWQFHLECKAEHLLFYIFLKALHMGGYR